MYAQRGAIGVKGMKPNNKKFFERVYDIVAIIPEGKVATYGQISLII